MFVEIKLSVGSFSISSSSRAQWAMSALGFSVSAAAIRRLGGGATRAFGGTATPRRCVSRAHAVWCAAGETTTAGSSDLEFLDKAKHGVADTDDDRFVYVGNFDFFTPRAVIESAVHDLLGVVLSARVNTVAVPGWRDKRLEDGRLIPRKKRDEGKQTRGFAVVEFDTERAGREAAEKLHGTCFEQRELRASPGVRADVRGVPETRKKNSETEEEEERMDLDAEAAEVLRRERRAHGFRQKKRKKAVEMGAIEGALGEVLCSHPWWDGKGNINTVAANKHCVTANTRNSETNEPSTKRSDGFVNPTREWWDDHEWRSGWGVLYSRWVDVEFAKRLGFMDWPSCPPGIDPKGSNKKGGEQRGARKRLQVESFLAILNAAKESRVDVGFCVDRDETRGHTSDETRSNNINEATQNQKNKLVVVDFGCGTGNLLLPLAYAEPNARFIGIDLNETSVELLLARAERAGLKNVQGVVGLAETYDGPCDVALALHVCGGGTDAVLLQAQARNAVFIVAPCCVGKLKDGGLSSISAMKKDVSGDDARAGDDAAGVVVRPGGVLPPMRVIHPRSEWMRGSVQRPAYLTIAACADWSGHQGVDPTKQSSESEELGRLPRIAKAAVECDRAAAAAEAGYGVRVMKMTHIGAGLKNDLIIGFPEKKDPLGEFVEGPDALFSERKM